MVSPAFGGGFFIFGLVELEFNTLGNEKQKECARAWIDPNVIEIVYGGSKGSAKSFTGVSLIFGDAFIYPETHYFIARTALNDLRKYTIPSIHEVFDLWELDQRYYKYNGQDNYYKLHNGSIVYLLEAKYMPSDPEFYRFGSMQMTRGWIEEAGQFIRSAKANLQASIGRWKNDKYNLSPKLLMTCNPSHNFLYDDFKKWRAGNLEPHKRFIQAFPQDNKMLPKDYVPNLLKILSSNEIQRLVHGNWDYDDDPSSLVDYDAVCDLFTNDHVIPGEKRISADLAMQGRDRFVAGHWQGLIAHVDIDKPKASGKEIEEDLRELKTVRGVPNSKIVADSDGLGAYLDSYIENIKTFHGGATAYNKEFFNLKSECAFKLAEIIRERKMKIVCSEDQQERIKDELIICLKRDSLEVDTTKKKLIPKKKMIELLGHSPDYFDWLLMGMYFEIEPEGQIVF